MSERIDKHRLVKQVAHRVGKDTDVVAEMVDATLEEIYEALKRGDTVALRNFGTFYVRPARPGWVFRFNPSQRFRRLFQWKSSYKGRL